MTFKFTPENIEELFGAEAAEQEDTKRLRKYFFKSKTYEDVRANLPLRILVAHKGIGKSAMFKVCFSEDLDQRSLSLWVRPDDLLNFRFDETTDLNALIRNWKSGLLDLIASKVVSFVGEAPTSTAVKTIAIAGAGITNALISFFKKKLGDALDPAIQATLEKFLTSKKILIYIDDLDRGWEGKPVDIRRISALLNALRDMSTDYPGLHFRVALRADVYFLVRTSDESTDKIERSVIWYSWTNHEIFQILVKRVGTFFDRQLNEKQLSGMQQWQLAKVLDSIMEPRFAGKGHWENAPTFRVLLSLVRKRPRDLIKLCSEAANNARRRDGELITTADLKDVFESYSQGRLQDTINEYRTELPAIERLLFGMKPARQERKTAQGYQYDTAKLLEKIENIQQGGKFSFATGKTASTKDLASFMYKINFLTARKELANGEIDRKYFEENRYISSQFVDFGYDWEVHPAYRWALQPDSIEDIFESLKLSSMDFAKT
ncbi:P-loop ATPase, Sll1717 family [Dongia sp.]|uniref:P-loop ATPase, Sll1717 family n=1 Tax=Dongia sp. TaxID=1977262 RepID=UPI0035B28C21